MSSDLPLGDFPPIIAYSTEPAYGPFSHEAVVRDFEQRLSTVVEERNALRAKCGQQRRELRRLNASIVDKLHRLGVAMDDIRELERQNREMRAFLLGCGVRVTFS